MDDAGHPLSGACAEQVSILLFAPIALICLLLTATFANQSCSGPESTRIDEPEQGDEPPLSDLDYAEIAYDCLELLSSYREVDLETARESELERQMEEALLNQELCAQALRTSYDGPGGSVMGNHLARVLPIHALRVELALSSRFDTMAGYCVILQDLVRALDADLTEINRALESARLRQDDWTMLSSLRELTYQSLQVSLLDYAESCR